MKEASFNMNETEKRAWTAYVKVCHRFLGNKIAENYQQILQEILSACKTKFFSLIHFFPKNIGVLSDEKGKRLHQDILHIEGG